MEGCFCGGMYVAGIELARAMDMIYTSIAISDECRSLLCCPKSRPGSILSGMLARPMASA